MIISEIGVRCFFEGLDERSPYNFCAFGGQCLNPEIDN